MPGTQQFFTPEAKAKEDNTVVPFSSKLSAIPELKHPEKPLNIKLRSTSLTIKQFIEIANFGISTLNTLIEKYNSTNLKAEKTRRLYQIYSEQKALTARLPQKHISYFPAYSEKIHHQLFNELQEHFALLGMNTLNEEVLQLFVNSCPFVAGSPYSLTEIIANMAPGKLDLLLQFLDYGEYFNANTLKFLYCSSEHGYDAFQKFLNTHSISFLGGKNSKSFKVTHLSTGSVSVLKAENAMTTIQSAAYYLRAHSMQEIFLPIVVARVGSFTDSEKNRQTRGLIITDFCSGRDLETYAHISRSYSEQIDEALTIYIQMATILENILNDNCAFPDMKNPNWLIENGRLRIMDTKSFAFINSQKKLNFNFYENIGLSLVNSDYTSPPELYDSSIAINCDADKMHAYIFGKNLYQFLTLYDFRKIYEMNEENIDFKHPIFSTPKGKALKELISNLVKISALSRLGISQAKLLLQRIQSLDSTLTTSPSSNSEQQQKTLHPRSHYRLFPDTPILTESSTEGYHCVL